MRVYNTYVKDKHYVATSFVPREQKALALNDSKLADVVEEPILEGAEETFDASIAAEYEKTPSSFDRSVEPPYGESPDVNVPNVWKGDLSSGMKVFGIENDEVPLVQFEIQLKGGILLENPNKIGVLGFSAGGHLASTLSTHHDNGLELSKIEIDKTSNVFHLIQRIQDEAHRFAVTYHKQVRSKGVFHSILDEIEGIGPVLKDKLLKKYKSVKLIKLASLEELNELGIHEKLAERLLEKLQEY